MGEYHIVGGNKLCGEIKINGGKNAILPILASVVLNDNVSIIHNVPKISDTYVAIEILESIGCKTNFDNNTLIVDARNVYTHEVPEYLVIEMRSSIIFLGGVLGRFKKCKIGYPGGCELGARPIDLHLKGLKSLGVDIVEEHGFIICTTDKLVGANIYLDFPSVGATENIMLTAVYAEGETVIDNAAREPEIVDLQNFLNSMGAKIKGAGTDKIIIQGIKKLQPSEYTIMPDRIVAGTFLVGAALTDGEIILKDVNFEHLEPILSKLLETGCTFKKYKDSRRISIKPPTTIKAIKKLRTSVHPGFPTDMQPQLMTLLAKAKGTSIFTETVFESRNKHISELVRMGANITLAPDGMTSVIQGVDTFKGAVVSSKDLRGGAALILAGLCAEGKTIVTNSKHVERGYEAIENTIRDLGGNIRFVK